MPKLLARGDDDTSVSSDEHSITDYLEEHELPLPITRNHDEESAKTTQLDEEENEVALPSVSVPNKFNVLSSEDAQISGTRATVHYAPYKNGIVNDKSNKNEHITVGNGEKWRPRKRVAQNEHQKVKEEPQ